jgi:hypothetical protein
MLGAGGKQDAQAKHRWPKFAVAMSDAAFVPAKSGSLVVYEPHPAATVLPY